MLEQTMQGKSPTLEGKVRCTYCNSAMTLADGIFSCPNYDGGHARDMYETSLLAGVIDRLVNRLTIEGTWTGVDSKIRETMEPQILEQTERLLASESEITRLNEEKVRVSGQVESGSRTYSEAAVEIGEINSAQAGLAYESMVVREELDRMEFITDPDGVRETANNHLTYLENPEPELVQELLDLLVEEVLITVEEPWVVYTRPVPGQPDPYGTNYERVNLI